jgi:RNA polymerase sigma-70 factor, ECF subfamily
VTNVTDTTQLVRSVRNGEAKAAELLVPILYDQLRVMAGAIFARQPASATLQPTALLHEAYLKLVNQSASHLTDRAHFMRLASESTRKVNLKRFPERGPPPA